MSGHLCVVLLNNHCILIVEQHDPITLSIEQLGFPVLALDLRHH